MNDEIAMCTYKLILSSVVLSSVSPEIPVPVRSGSGGIWAGTGPSPVPVDLAGTRPVPQFFSKRVFKVSKITVENIYSLKSENV